MGSTIQTDNTEIIFTMGQAPIRIINPMSIPKYPQGGKNGTGGIEGMCDRDRCTTSTRVALRCVRTNISAISEIFEEMNELFMKLAKICHRYAEICL